MVNFRNKQWLKNLAQEHKDEYTDLVSVHTIAKIMPKIENKIRTEVLNDNGTCSTH